MGKHLASPDFWASYRSLNPEVRDRADRAYELLKQDPRHRSLRFKKAGKVFSARVDLNHRAIAVEVDEGFLWIWIGKHSDYDHLLKSLG